MSARLVATHPAGPYHPSLSQGGVALARDSPVRRRRPAALHLRDPQGDLRQDGGGHGEQQHSTMGPRVRTVGYTPDQAQRDSRCIS